MQRQQWLEERRKGLGGSDVAAILGLSPWRSAVDVWLDKTGQTPLDDEPSLAMEFGSYAEEFVARQYEARTGRKVQRYTAMLRHPDHPWMLGNIDRLVVPEGAKRASHRREIRTDTLLECKTASAYAASSWGPDGTDEVPDYYACQVAWYLALTGCRHGDVAVLIGNSDFRVYRLERDLELEEMLIARAGEWWERHVVKGEVPEPQIDTDARKLFKKDNGAAVIADGEVLAAVEELRGIRAKLKELEEAEKRARARIEAVMGEAAVLEDAAGRVLATWKAAKDSRKTDWKALATELLAGRDDADELKARFTQVKPGSRRFLLKPAPREV